MSMTDQLQAARVIYFRHKERGLVGNPDPMLAAVLALGEGDRRDAERFAWCAEQQAIAVKYPDGWQVFYGDGKEPELPQYPNARAAIDAAMTTTRPESP